MWGPRHTTNPSRELVTEVEAFLDGSMETYLERQGRLVPDWAYVNRLAHCDVDGLGRLASAKAIGHGRRVDWMAAMASVAEVLRAEVHRSAVGDDDSSALRLIQRDRIGPYELQLMRRERLQVHTSPDRAKAELLGVLGCRPGS